MMERHWLKLQGITQKTVNFKSPNFCLEDLIKLELYRFSEDVNELVDGAQKESKIETRLQKIEATWEDEPFEFKEYGDTFILGAMDEIVENVEQNQMDLMAMQSSKDVEEFKEKVNYWQKTLRQVDLVIQIWLKVQKNWQRLEPIFLQSEDIRQQLPDDTKRFEKIDIDWKEMQREASEDPGVVPACTFDGRDELLNTFHQEIELCEKALFDYLGQKQKIFPRFYFVSNQALLDILSNGNNPEKVDQYIGDCFPGMRRLDFDKPEGSTAICKQVKGMYSNEGEYVGYDEIFTCTGAVESYLCDFENKMMAVLRDILESAKSTADQWDLGEKPRHKWLEDYCAQISLLATQILWTEETAHAFDDLEGGSENAMKEYYQQILTRLSHLIERVRGDLSSDLRVKIITIITIDVHERDVVDMFNLRKIMEAGSFQW
jgi:dynein heavy chain